MLNWKQLQRRCQRSGSPLCYALLVAFLMFESAPVVAAQNTVGAGHPETTQFMRQMLEQLSALKKHLVSEEQFNDKKNHARILDALSQLRRTVERSKHFESLNTENFRFSRGVLEEQIRETEHLFRSGGKSLARWKLNSAIGVCAQCHAQLPSRTQRYGDFLDPKTFVSPIDQAEFLFATRAYDKATEIYEKVVDGYPENKHSRDDLERSLERLLTFYSRIRRDPKAALQKFKTFEANQKLPPFVRTTIQSWNLQLSKWASESIDQTGLKTETALLELARKELSAKTKGGTVGADSPHLVTVLRISGLLYEALWKNQTTENLSEFLYWLALSERTLAANFFFSLSSMYFRECIVRGATQPIARKCFQELEMETLLGYTGSRGTDVPPEVMKELDHYRQLVEPKASGSKDSGTHPR